MRKYINTLFMGLLIAASITSCSEEQGTNPGEDSRPAVIIYQYAPGEGYNADNDIKLRISANSQTQEAYYLCELTSEKADFIEINGEAAYMDQVTEKGIKLEEISGTSNQDVVVTGLIGDYTITAVAVKGNTKTAFESSFYGIQWDVFGEGTYHSSMFNATFAVEVRKAAHAEWYKLIEPFGEGKDLVIKMNGTNAAIEQQYVFTDSKYGAVYAEGKGVLTDNNINMTLTFTCSAGSFGEKQEILELPTK